MGAAVTAGVAALWVCTLTQPPSSAADSRTKTGVTRIGIPWERGCPDCRADPWSADPGSSRPWVGSTLRWSAAQQLADRREARVRPFRLAFGIGDRIRAIALHFGRGQLVEEAARCQPQLFAPALRLARVREPQRLLGPGDADIEQAPLLVEAALLEAGLVRQVAVLQADDEHEAELQALGRVQAHQPHLVAGIALVRVREQGEGRGEFARAGVAPAVEPVREFVQVAPARLELRLV